MSVSNQYQALFDLESNTTYLNCATMSAMLNSVKEAGLAGLQRKCNPQYIQQEDFFIQHKLLTQQFATLINAPADSIALMPSVSYGLATVAKNVIQVSPHPSRKKIVILGGEFPSDVYAWTDLIKEHHKELHIVEAPDVSTNRGQAWNQALINALNEDTLMLCLSPTHWADGTIFPLLPISAKCRELGILLIIDGTQHIGAYPFDIQEIQPDFVVAATYKWLLGPYGNALAYVAPRFANGNPLEYNWITRANSHDFTLLMNYTQEFHPGAFRFNMGEMSNFINNPMILNALLQLNKWTPKLIQDHAQSLAIPFLDKIKNLPIDVEWDHTYRANHLFGLRTQFSEYQMTTFKTKLKSENISISIRGKQTIRVSIHLWNDTSHLDKLFQVLAAIA